MNRASLDDLAGGDAAVNAAIIRKILAGEKSPRRDVVPSFQRRSTAWWQQAKADHLHEAVPVASKAIDSGVPAEKLQQAIAEFYKPDVASSETRAKSHLLPLHGFLQFFNLA